MRRLGIMYILFLFLLFLPAIAFSSDSSTEKIKRNIESDRLWLGLEKEISGKNPLEFLIVGDNCSWKVLDPEDICTVEALFASVGEGDRSACLVSDESATIAQLTEVDTSRNNIDLAGQWQSFTTREVDREGLQVKGVFQIKNNGTDYFCGFVKIEGHFSNDAVFSADDIYKARKIVNIKGRHGALIHFDFTAGGLTGKYLIVVIDSNDMAAEYDEDNNVVVTEMR